MHPTIAPAAAAAPAADGAGRLRGHWAPPAPAQAQETQLTSRRCVACSAALLSSLMLLLWRTLKILLILILLIFIIFIFLYFLLKLLLLLVLGQGNSADVAEVDCLLSSLALVLVYHCCQLLLLIIIAAPSTPSLLHAGPCAYLHVLFSALPRSYPMRGNARAAECAISNALFITPHSLTNPMHPSVDTLITLYAQCTHCAIRVSSTPEAARLRPRLGPLIIQHPLKIISLGPFIIGWLNLAYHCKHILLVIVQYETRVIRRRRLACACALGPHASRVWSTTVITCCTP
jgi:hypothetical protein